MRPSHTPFSWACEEGHSAIASILLDQGAQVDEADLPRCVANGNVEVVKMLLENGADAAATDEGGWTPLHLASRNGHLEITMLLR